MTVGRAAADTRTMTLRDLERRTAAARKAAQEAEQAARDAKAKAVELAIVRSELEDELDLELWVAAQVDNGVPEEAIDRDRRIVLTLPPGPTYDVVADGS